MLLKWNFCLLKFRSTIYMYYGNSLELNNFLKKCCFWVLTQLTVQVVILITHAAYSIAAAVWKLKCLAATQARQKLQSRLQAKPIFSAPTQMRFIYIQCNLDLVTLNIVTTCDFVTIFQRPFFSTYMVVRLSDVSSKTA